MATATLTMAKHIFNAFEEFNLPSNESSNELQLSTDSFQQEQRNIITTTTNTDSALLKLFKAYEKFNLPGVASTESLSSLASLSTNSSSSNLEDSIMPPSDASIPTKLFHAIEKFTLTPQGHSRLPGAPTAAPVACSTLTFEQLNILQKILIALEDFIHPAHEHDQDTDISSSNGDIGDFPKFC